MKRIILGAVSALCLSTSAMPVLAQESLCGAGIPSVNVKEGESLWKFKQDQWPDLVTMNPQLGAKWRKFTTAQGGPGVKLAIGEPICGVTRDDSGAIVSATESGPANVVPFVEEHPIATGIGGLITALLLAFLALCAWVAFQRRKSPFAGTPQVTGGIRNAEAASARFNEQITARHPGRSFRILDSVEGTATGDMMVSYGNGEHPKPRRMNGERIFHARVRFTDAQGGEEDIYMLEACGNDVRRHDGLLRYVPSQNFVFAPVIEPAAASAPTPVVAAEAVSPAPEPVPQPVAANEQTLAEVLTTPTDQPVFACYATDGRLSSMQFDHNKVDVVIGHNGRTTVNFLTAPAADVSVPAEAPAEERRA